MKNETKQEKVEYDITKLSVSELQNANFGEGHIEHRGEQTVYVCDTFKRRLSPGVQRKGFLA